MISRDWWCQSDRCGHKFHSFEKSNPPCPKCGNMRVDWIPGGGHVMSKAPGFDRVLREAADAYGMTNLNSPSASRLNRAAPKYEQPPLNYDSKPMHFAPGFSSPISGNGATCLQSTSPMNLNGKVRIGTISSDGNQNSATPLPRTNLPGPLANTRIEGRFRGDK